MSRRARKENNEAEVNMTPMLDIVFIMLIFFIVTSTFVREFGMDVSQPNNNEEDKPNDNKTRAITVRVCANEAISIDNRSIDLRSVRANVERKIAETPGAVVIVMPERKAETGSLVQVMDQARAANATVSISPLQGGCRGG